MANSQTKKIYSRSLKLSERQNLQREYYEWLATESVKTGYSVADSPMNVISFLEYKRLLKTNDVRQTWDY